MAENSTSLLIHGNSTNAMITPRLPILRPVAPVRPHCKANESSLWLCSQHMDAERDSNATVGAMMRNLIGQLQAQYKHFDLGFIGRYYRKCLGGGDVKGMCSLFQKLVVQLLKDTLLFCIIDSVSSYEDRKRRDDVVNTVERLHSIRRKCSQAFRLLMTSSSRTTCIKDVVLPQNILLVPQQVDSPNQIPYVSRPQRYASRPKLVAC